MCVYVESTVCSPQPPPVRLPAPLLLERHGFPRGGEVRRHLHQIQHVRGVDKKHIAMSHPGQPLTALRAEAGARLVVLDRGIKLGDGLAANHLGSPP